MDPADFRWQALLQRTDEPVFLLDRHRRILFVNQAWEKLTGISAVEARGMRCQRRRPTPEEPRDIVIRALCCPPPDALHGNASKARRRVPGSNPDQWWDLEFLPFRHENELLCVLGKIARVATDEQTRKMPLSEKLLALREKVAGRYGLDLFTSSLPALHRVADQVRLGGQTHAAVFLRGEPGTGKQTTARTIHFLGARREQTFAVIDCRHLPVDALASTLFSGAGLIRGTGIGTLYFKEPSHLPRDLQARLVAWLGTAEDGVAPRVMAGMSVDPGDEVRAGRLLEELRYALATLVIELPPLRERLADLPLLVERLLERANLAHADAGTGPVKGLKQEAWEVLRAYGWRENLRELYAVLLDSRAHAQGELLEVSNLPAHVRLAVRMEQTPGPMPDHPLPLDKLLEEAERRLIQLALGRTQGNRTRAAELLAIWRQRLTRRMEALGIAEAGGETE